MTSTVLQNTLRLAATVAVVNGFASLTGLPFGYYASLAVLTVSVGAYGNTLELGRQRLVGTVVGAVVVFFGYRAWGHLPVMVALPLALLLARVIAGSLRLTVGYGVGCMVVVVGWLTHDQQLASWIPLRVAWTAFGILVALLSLRLFWPSQARVQQSAGLLQLLVHLGQAVASVAGEPGPNQPPPKQRRQRQSEQIRSLRSALQSLRDQRLGALVELGPMAARHPLARMWSLLDQACEALILDLEELRRLPEPSWQQWGVDGIQHAGVEFARQVAQRLAQWQVQLRRSRQLQPPPSTPRPALPLAALQTPEALAASQHLNAEQLTAVASQWMVLSRIHHTLESTERQWLAIVS